MDGGGGPPKKTTNLAMDMQEVPHYLGKRNDLNEISSMSKIQYDHQVI